ncbi:MAG: hypothetical protein VST70_05035, partial [Nitrospirota bacterium]|nr:hypothetical protein [Nitrospirota bacterium]
CVFGIWLNFGSLFSQKRRKGFDPDAMPARYIITHSVVNKITERYHSAVSANPAQPSIPSLHFNGGEFKHKKIIPINSITFEERRLLLSVSGTSEDADSLFEDLLKTISEVLGASIKFLPPLVKSDQTSCFATFKVDIQQYFSNPFLLFCEKRLPKFNQIPKTQISAQPFSLRIEISYKIDDPVLSESNISIFPKHLVIERRLQTPPKKNMYFVSSPFESNTHIKLIEELQEKLQKT